MKTKSMSSKADVLENWLKDMLAGKNYQQRSFADGCYK